VGASRTSPNSAAPQTIPPSTPSQQHKKGNHTVRKTFSILASSSYRTHSHYTFDTPALFWNLPPPMWNLDDASLKLPTLQKKPKRLNKKKKPQPIKH